MKVIRFQATPEGESRFQEVDIPITEPRKDNFGFTMHMSGTFASPSVRVVELPVGLDQGWHNAPARQIVVLLQGRMEVGTSDGQKKQWGAGTAVIADDITGKGHVTRVVEGPALVMFVQLPENFDVDSWKG
jgi:hypothetical protein